MVDIWLGIQNSNELDGAIVLPSTENCAAQQNPLLNRVLAVLPCREFPAESSEESVVTKLG